MDGLVLLITIVQVVWIHGSASHYSVRMPYPNPAGVTYSGITPYRTVTLQTALPSPVVPSPVTPLATVPSVALNRPEIVPEVAVSPDWQPEVNRVHNLNIIVNGADCNDKQCDIQKIDDTIKVNFLTSKTEENYSNTPKTRFNGIQQSPSLLDLNYPVCYTPVDNTMFSPLIQVSPFGHQPIPIPPFDGLQILSGPLFKPYNPPLPLPPPLNFQVLDFLPEVPDVSFLPPQIPAYPTVATLAPPANLPSAENDDTDSVVIENPELKEASSLRNVNNTSSQNQTDPLESTGNYEKQILNEFRQRQILRRLTKRE